MTTLNLSTITFGEYTVTPTIESSPPVGAKEFNALVDLRPNKNLKVKINAKADLLTGDLTWTFTSLDPDTGLPLDPSDPNGFLDPGMGGSCLFTVTPKNTTPTGTVVTNRASIVFDFNDPLDTNSWFNTIDSDKPVSNVLSLSPTQNSAQFLVKWQSSDVGSGARDVTVAVSDNGGPFTPWLTNAMDAQATFTGTPGHAYAFKSAARDNVLNAEDEHANPDAITTLANAATDSTATVQVTRSGLRRNRTTGRYVQDVTLKNVGVAALTGPMSLVFDSLPAGVAVFSPDGSTAMIAPFGSPYKNAPVRGGTLRAGQSVKMTMEFVNPSNAAISYATRVLTGAGQR